MKNIKLVTDGMGNFAIRKGWLFHEYFDLNNPGFWWNIDQRFYGDCWASKEKALEWYGKLKPKSVIDG